MSSFKTYDGTDIFENQLNANKKAYVTGTPINTDGHVNPQVFDTNVYLGENAGELVANKFIGNLNGTGHNINEDKAWFADTVKVGGTSFNDPNALPIATVTIKRWEETD